MLLRWFPSGNLPSALATDILSFLLSGEGLTEILPGRHTSVHAMPILGAMVDRGGCWSWDGGGRDSGTLGQAAALPSRCRGLSPSGLISKVRGDKGPALPSSETPGSPRAKLGGDRCHCYSCGKPCQHPPIPHPCPTLSKEHRFLQLAF